MPPPSRGLQDPPPSKGPPGPTSLQGPTGPHLPPMGPRGPAYDISLHDLQVLLWGRDSHACAVTHLCAGRRY